MNENRFPIKNAGNDNFVIGESSGRMHVLRREGVDREKSFTLVLTLEIKYSFRSFLTSLSLSG